MRDAVETYLRDLRAIRSTGAATKETSYYEPLATLLNRVGHDLKPRVQAVLQLKNTGAGIPDGGLFSAEQLRTADTDQPLLAQTPARGVVEVKGTGDDVDTVAGTDQVAKYVDRYGQVLVTNYRDFLLVDRDHQGAIHLSERLTLAADEGSFWSDTSDPRAFADRIGDQLVEYLHRVMVRQVSLTQPRDVALLLASYARDMRTRLERQRLDDLLPLRESLESALGISFQGEPGAHFFRSTVVQTLFYGMFSAWVLQNRGIGRRSKQEPFDWRLAGWSLKVPAIQSLFHEFIKPDSVERLGLADLLDWTGEMLNRVDPDQFFTRFSDEHAVQYFYEPFLEAFDPELRKQLGVWYTPHEIVTYMVERVDTVLREELGVARGLADPTRPLGTASDIPTPRKRRGGYVGPTCPRWWPGSAGQPAAGPSITDAGFTGQAWHQHWQTTHRAMVVTPAIFGKAPAPQLPNSPTRAELPPLAADDRDDQRDPCRCAPSRLSPGQDAMGRDEPAWRQVRCPQCWHVDQSRPGPTGPRHRHASTLICITRSVGASLSNVVFQS